MDLGKVISEMTEVPSGQRIIPKLQAMLRDPLTDIEDIANLLKVDLSLSAKILRFANSSFFAGSTPASGLDNAIQRIGLREINRLVSLASTKDMLGKPLDAYHVKKGEMLEESVCCAQLMYSIGSVIDREAVDTYYTAGLFHGIGKIVINHYLRQRDLFLYGAGDDIRTSMAKVGPEAERKIMGFDHAEAGAAFLASWGFPESICDPIRFQIDPISTDASIEISFALHYSRGAAIAYILNGPEAAEAIPVDPICLKTIGLEEDAVKLCASNAFEEFERIKSTVLN